MAIDPVTAGLVIGGVKGLGDMFAGPSDDVKLARDQLRQRIREYEGREDRRDDALRLGSARSQAQNLLRAKLMGSFGGMQPQKVDASSLFADPTNPFANQTGTVQRSGPSPLSPISFSEAELGVGQSALPEPAMRGRQAVRRSLDTATGAGVDQLRDLLGRAEGRSGSGIQGRTWGKVSDKIRNRLNEIMQQRGMI